MDSPLDWLATRTPPAPDELTAWFEVQDVGGGAGDAPASGPGFLLRAGLAHLEEAVARTGRDREGAHDLLAADALITYGCEASCEAADVRAALREVLLGVWKGGAAG